MTLHEFCYGNSVALLSYKNVLHDSDGLLGKRLLGSTARYAHLPWHPLCPSSWKPAWRWSPPGWWGCGGGCSAGTTRPPRTLGSLLNGNAETVNYNNAAGRTYFTASALKSKQATKKIAAAADFCIFLLRRVECFVNSALKSLIQIIIQIKPVSCGSLLLQQHLFFRSRLRWPSHLFCALV